MIPKGFTAEVRPFVFANKRYNKIFGIGYNKTGTTTLEAIFRLYGFSLPVQAEQETRLTMSCFATNYTELSSFVNQYDAFQDMPFSQGTTYVVADALFPNSKFILAERESEAWFRSMTSFHAKMFGVGEVRKLTEQDVLTKFNYLYPGYAHANMARFLTTFDRKGSVTNWDKLYDKDYYIEQYELRNAQIKKYFMAAPEKLLVLDMTAEKTTEKICRFLDIPERFIIDTPHMNKT